MKRKFITGPWKRRGMAIGLCLSAMACGSPRNDDSNSEGPTTPLQEDLCVSSLKKECEELSAIIERNFSRQGNAANDGELEAAIFAGIEADHAASLRRLYRSGYDRKSRPVLDERTRYEFMQKIAKGKPTETKPDKVCKKDKACFKTAKEHAKIWQRYVELTDKGANSTFKVKVDVNHTKYRMVAGLDASGTIAIVDQAYATIQGLIAEAERLASGSKASDASETSCSVDLRDVCTAKLTQIAELRKAHESASQGRDLVKSNQLVLDLNQALDELKAHMDGYGPGSQEVKDIIARYKSLRSIVGGERSSYTVEEQNEVQKVKAAFGELYLASTVDADGVAQWKSVEVGERKPWSGYWYPFRSNDMFDGSDSSSFEEGGSPLEVFDQLLASVGRTPGAAAWERSRQEMTSWESSDGLCDAWSVASALTAEPLESVELYDVQFSAAHLKGLLVQKYSNYSKERYGISYRGYIETDGLGQDLRPEAFHQLAVKALSESRVPIVDTDPNFLIWNMPLFRYEWKVEHDPENANAYLVTARPWYVKFRTKESVEPTNYFVGRDSNLYLPTYRYRLFFDSADEVNEEKHILYGEWIVDDRAAEHPDTVYMVDEGNAATPRNPFIADNLDLLNELVARFE